SAILLRRDGDRHGFAAQRERPLGGEVGEPAGGGRAVSDARPGAAAVAPAGETTMTPFDTEFYKMTAGGNDFILLDNRSGSLRSADLAEFIRRICTRAPSVGAEVVIFLD